MTQEQVKLHELKAFCTGVKIEDKPLCMTCDYWMHPRYGHMCGSASALIKHCCKWEPIKEEENT